MPAFAALVDWHRESGSDGVVVGGSTGESGALDEDEFAALVRTAVARAGGALPVIAGCGAPATRKALRLVHVARDAGAAASLAVTPYYARPTQEGLYRHYSVLADEGGLPVILYNVPSRTGCDLLPATVARLAPHPRIVAIKEARCEPERMQALLPLRREDFFVLSGDDPTALRAMIAGADGVISVAANVCPETFARLCRLAREGEHDAAHALDETLVPLYEALAVEPNPIPVKWLLHRLGRVASTLRLPLLELSPPRRADVEAQLDLLDRLEPAARRAAGSAA